MIRIIEVAKFGDNFKELIQRPKKYEHIIESLMNDSKVVFPNRYRYISDQHSHQCDFEDADERAMWDRNSGPKGKDCANQWYFGKLGANGGD